MARDTDTDTPMDGQPKTALGLQMPLPLAERRRLLQAEPKAPKPGQIFTDWALI